MSRRSTFFLCLSGKISKKFQLKSSKTKHTQNAPGTVALFLLSRETSPGKVAEPVPTVCKVDPCLLGSRSPRAGSRVLPLCVAGIQPCL